MEKLIAGFKKCFDHPEFREPAEKRAIPLPYADPAGFEAFLAGMEESLIPALKVVGLYQE